MKHNESRRPGIFLRQAAACLFLLAFFLTGGCAEKPGEGRPPVLDPLGGSKQSPQQSPQQTAQQAESASSDPLVGALAELSAARNAGEESPVAQPAPQKAGQSALTVRQQLLASAGRSDGQQPEPGFLLDVPDSVWAGEPFLVSAGGRGLVQAVFTWRGKSISVQPGGQGQFPESATVMLSVLQKQQEKSLPLGISLTWDSGRTESMTAAIPVRKRDHPVQRLTVQQKYVTPDPSVQEKIKQDQREVREIVAKTSPVKKWEVPFLRPVPGVVTSVYGLRRVFNGEERNPHRGVDFDAKKGDPIHAVADGTVVLVNEHYYGGNTVIVDHGLGVFTLYLHMSSFAVQPGQEVKRGDVLGAIGSTGRVTGPHLHLSLAVQGEMVDAATMVKGMGMK